MRKSNLEKLLEIRRKKSEPMQMTVEDLFLLLLAGDQPKEKRQANPTQREFVFDPARIKGFMGAAGSAKTSALCSSGWLRALLQPGSKGLVSRANYNDLMDTTGLRMTEMLNRLPKGVLLDRDKSPPMKWYVQSVPTLYPDGTVKCDDVSAITFMGLQDGLGSYEFDWAIIDEMSEVEEARVHEVNTRLRNRPKSWDEGYEAYSLSGAWNPTAMIHWLYKACTGLDSTGNFIGPPWIKLFTCGPKENAHNLPPGYYEQLAATLPADMRMRLVEGQWGPTFGDMPVYREFNYDLHTSDGLKYDPYGPLYRFWDFGYRHPYCCWVQPTTDGRLLVLAELVLTNIEIEPFVHRCMQLGEKYFPNHTEYYDYGDPAARQLKDTGSTLQSLSKAGIYLRYKVSSIDEGLRVVRLALERMINGKPQIQIDRRRCVQLIDMFRGGYQMDKLGQKPVKDGYYDHSADAFRYGCVNVLGGGLTLKDLSKWPSSVAYGG